ncbi:MAG: CBS domain-containing protein [Pseudomonadota bacterium]|nr:CBS domain-containing protein [Pseudomonadota bacterium]
MNVGAICTRRVAVVERTSTVMAAARRMREEHVGDLVVVGHHDGKLLPVGIITDRDIVVGCVARSAEFLEKLLVEDLLVRPLVTATADEDSLLVARRMREREVRRIPVVDANGELTGILSVDDLIGSLHAELAEIATLLGHQHTHEERMRP